MSQSWKNLGVTRESPVLTDSPDLRRMYASGAYDGVHKVDKPSFPV